MDGSAIGARVADRPSSPDQQEAAAPRKSRALRDVSNTVDTTSTSATSANGKSKARSQSKSAKRRSGRAKKSSSVGSSPAPVRSSVTTRSGRVSKSTTVSIAGHAVKIDNNYVVRGGSYVYRAVEAALPIATSSKKKGGGKKKKSAGVKPRAKKSRNKAANNSQRVVSAGERKRIAHNDEIRRRQEEAEARRRIFFARNVNALRKLVDPKVLEALVAEADNGNNENSDEEGEQAASSSFSRDDAGPVYMQPDLIRGDMRDYQLAGLSWMVSMHRRGMPMILGDEMGLGKTLQTISYLAYLKETENRTGPSLVVCPLSVLYSWGSELQKWAPDLKVLRFHSSDSGEASALVKQGMANTGNGGLLSYDVVITTYEMCKSAALKNFWSRLRFNVVVLDEGHIIKESRTQTSRAVRRLHSESKLLLTGTPLQNNLQELWAILNYLYPEYFTDACSQTFANAFDIGANRMDPDLLDSAHEVLNLFMLRRMKTEVEKLMPKKIETKVLCPLSSMQIHWYKGLLMKDINMLAEASSHGSGAPANSANVYKNLRALFFQLRKCCSHPFLFDGAEADVEATTVEDLLAASGKLAVLDKLLRRLFTGRHRTVLFSQWTRVLDIIEDYCSLRGWNYCRFDGSTARAKRNHIVKQFNHPQSDTFIFLMSTRSGGMGLNLQTADTCILFDSDYNPQADLQAMARVHRIGQKKTVHVYRLVSAGTIEERIVELAQKKLYLDQMVNRGNSATAEKETVGLSTTEMLSSLTFGSNAVFGGSDSGLNTLPTDDDIRHITDRTRSEDDSLGKVKGGITQTVQDFNCNAELTDTSKFGGIDFGAIREEHWQNGGKRLSEEGLAAAWSSKEGGKRQRKLRITMIKAAGSGYGSVSVPVLASNNYELENGESSVFARELSGRGGHFAVHKREVPRSGTHFGSSDLCQLCGEGKGEDESLTCCPFCPVSAHDSCLAKHGWKQGSKYAFGTATSCHHHRCLTCNKTVSTAGGILFPCQGCPTSFCEDCLGQEKDASIIGACPRFEELGFNSTKQFCYIHCSKDCEEFSERFFGWAPEKAKKPVCPPEMDVSYAFGKRVDKEVPIPRQAMPSTEQPVAEPTHAAAGDDGEKSDVTSGTESPTFDPPTNPAGTNTSAAENNASEDDVVFAVGDIIEVAARMRSNPIKLGGVGRITMVHNEKYYGLRYDIKYVLGGFEPLVEPCHIKAAKEDEARKPRRAAGKRKRWVEMDSSSPRPSKVTATKQSKKAAKTARPDSSTGTQPSTTTADANAFVPSQPRTDQYDVFAPVTSDGLLIKLSQKAGGDVRFKGYVRKKDGSKGPAEVSNLFRNVGDKFVAVDGISVVNASFQSVVDQVRYILKSGLHKGFVHLRLEDISRTADCDLASPAPLSSATNDNDAREPIDWFNKDDIDRGFGSRKPPVNWRGDHAQMRQWRLSSREDQGGWRDRRQREKNAKIEAVHAISRTVKSKNGAKHFISASSAVIATKSASGSADSTSDVVASSRSDTEIKSS